jgi:CheY-like chemotaxis protein
VKVKEPNCKYQSVMLIDDNELDNYINQKTIEANQFAKKVYVNTSAKGAIEFLTNLAMMGEDLSSLHPSIIFIDINMPMMDGFQFTEHFLSKLATKLKQAKLVILTSSVFHEDVKKAKDISEEIVFLHKPLTKDMLSVL